MLYDSGTAGCQSGGELARQFLIMTVGTAPRMGLPEDSKTARGLSHIFDNGNQQLQQVFNNKKTPLILIAIISVLIHAPNLLDYPAWFFDEGAYLSFSKQWVTSGHLGYYEHPFGAFVILGALFLTLNPSSYLVPRVLMVIFSAVDGVLLYKIAKAAYSRSEMFAFVAAMIYVATPLSARYLRLVVVDNFMALFLLASVLLVLIRPKDRIFSALLFGASLLSKQTAIFFLPAMLFFLWHQKRRLIDTLVWVGFAAVLPAIWAIYGVYEIGFPSLLSQQLVLTGLTGERAVGAASLIVQRIYSRDPFTFLGLAGIVWALYKRDSIVAFPVAYLGSFVVLFLKISTVYLIPALPFFALVAAELLTDIVDLVPRLSTPVLKRMTFATIVLVLIILSVSVVVTQSPATAQSDAVSFVVNQNPRGAIMSATYLWLFQQDYPSINVYDRGSVPWSQLTNSTLYLIVDFPGDLNTINAIPEYQRLYQSSSVEWSETTYGYTVQVLNGIVT